MAAANYNRPKPADPLWYRPDCWLVLHCRHCGHALRERVRDFQTRHLLPGDMRFHELRHRLKCSRCDRKELSMDVVR
jgi:hypothetical protein